MSLQKLRENLKLRPFQSAGVESMLRSPANKIYLADEQGLGKTISAFEYANRIGAARVLYCCPASLRLNVAREADLWFKVKGKNQYAKAILSSKDFRDVQKKSLVDKGYKPSPFIVSYDLLVSNEQLRSYVINRKWDLAIFDEVNDCRGVDAQRSWIVHHLAEINPRVLFLSGTPIENSAADIFFPLKALVTAPEVEPYFTKSEQHLFSDFKLFAQRFTFVKRTKWATEKCIGIRNHEELKGLIKRKNGKDDNLFFIRRLKQEVLKDLPDKSYNKIDIDLNVNLSVDNPFLDRFLESFEDDNVAAYTKEDSPNKKVMGTVRRELGEAVASHPDSYYVPEQLLKNEQPIVIFAWHRNVIDLIAETLKAYNPKTLTGETSPKQKQRAVDAIQNGETDLLISNIKAGGVGFNITRPSDVFFFEQDWLPSRIAQATDRLHRMGQKNAVTAHFLVTKNPFHQKFIKAMIQKQRAIDRVI